jgi:two-component system sensor histidine kinase UhpB
MDHLLRILILEDEAADAELMERELRKVKIDFVSRRVQTRETFLERLSDFSPDLILSDYSLPRFDGLSALAFAKEKCPNAPFILVSGAIGEERAIEILKSGATDYVLKDRLSRLAPSVQRALREVEERDELRRMEEALKAERRMLFALLEELPGQVVLHAPDYSIRFSNRYFRSRFGDPGGKPCYQVMNGLSRPCEDCRPFRVFETQVPLEWELKSSDGRVFQMYAYPFSIADSPPSVLALGIDITRRKEAEEALRESETRLRHLSTQLLSAQENERKHIAQELHDSIGQSLAAIRFRTERALEQVPDLSLPGKTSLEAISAMVGNAIEEVRKLQKNLRPVVLDDSGILAAIDWFCREYREIYSSIVLDTRFEIQEGAVPDALKIIVFRIIQESLNNVAKHSGASQVRLSLSSRDGRIELGIRDNGRGFDVREADARASARRSLGLTSMRERVELSGGRFSIESSPDAGTFVRASWPL